MWRDSRRRPTGRRGVLADRPLATALGRALTAAIICALSVSAAPGQDLIVLRNTEIIRGHKVLTADADGARLDDGRVIGWDDIETAKVSPGLQADVDELLKTLGTPLFRIRSRLKVGDFQGALAPAEAVRARFLYRASESGLMVSQALMWGRLAAGRREEALLAHLECFAKLRVRPELAGTLPGRRRPKVDLETAMTVELSPVWFDRQAAAAVKADVLALAAKLPAPRPAGVYIYCATLCQAAGDEPMAARMIAAVKSSRGADWQQILGAQSEIERGAPGASVGRLRAALGRLAKEDRPVALYWLSRAGLVQASPPPGDPQALTMLSVAAVYSESHPELAAAALHHTMQYFDDREQAAEAVRVRRELLERYGQTFHARLAAQPP